MLPVFYTPKAVSHPKSFSPSASKPEKVVARWKEKFKNGIEVIEHKAFDPADLITVHDPGYVNGVLRGTIDTGFDFPSAEIAVSCLYTCGGVLEAAMWTLEQEEKFPVACAPYSGFHHAGMDFGGGYCTFNGLMATAATLLNHNQVDSVLILDCDYHWGNGTQDILDRHPSDMVALVRHWSAGEAYFEPSQANDFFNDLKKTLHKYRDVDLILYQAGADAHIADPLGGFLTSEQLAQRDRMVFESCANHGIPLVWTLAGGYQDPIEKVLDIHDTTLEEAFQAYI
jgi:acetoin utilization deacetylase AcuC-like enzyme